jgi:hypothetical protein
VQPADGCLAVLMPVTSRPSRPVISAVGRELAAKERLTAWGGRRQPLFESVNGFPARRPNYDQSHFNMSPLG